MSMGSRGTLVASTLRGEESLSFASLWRAEIHCIEERDTSFVSLWSAEIYRCVEERDTSIVFLWNEEKYISTRKIHWVEEGDTSVVSRRNRGDVETQGNRTTENYKYKITSIEIYCVVRCVSH
jgi:hypothetical protein